MKKVILFGASGLGKIAYDVLRSSYEICYFCDNDYNKWGKQFLGKNIIPPDELIEFKEEYCIIIASMYSFEIAIQLQQYGITNIKTFIYKKINNKLIYRLNDVFRISDIYDIDLKVLENKINIQENLNKTVSYNKTIPKTLGNKNVLVIAYLFPPIGGSGVQRTLKFVKYLCQFGWNPIVLTVGDNFCEEKEDITLLKEIPNNVRVIRIDHNINRVENLSITEIENIYQIYIELSNYKITEKFIDECKNDRGNTLLIPDNQIIWISNVINEIDKIINFKDINMIFSTSAPYSDHILGYYLKKKYNNIPWVADFRDEWTNNHIFYYDKTKYYYKIQHLMEENIVKSANKVITVSEVSMENYKSNFDLDDSKIITITNGFDEEDFIGIEVQDKKNSKFTIIFNGTVYEAAPPYNLIIAIDNLIKKKQINEDKIEMIFIGNVKENIKEKIMKISNEVSVKFNGYMEHKESLKIASKGDLLFNHAGVDEKCKASYTGKIFEYLRLCKPILVFSPKDSILEKLINKLNRGISITGNNINEIEEAVLYFYNKWNEDEKTYFRKEDVQNYERKILTKKLAEIFYSLEK